MSDHDKSNVSPRGFAAMDERRRREVASLGGRIAHARGRAHRFTPEEARKAGQKGGSKISRNRKPMAELGDRGTAHEDVSETS
ncbi:stress-induced protein [Dyella acidisoli]|uniref:Stress-induced protein n=1 Tax=Dyella acidisoli TaxID=1867834 RepID=A0ABQ5XW70_9GAMM|nr:stress-induced protein [Dyella acidisoli]GLQ95012.1 stress-induced protein [Dyella acidisoli]